MTFPPDAAPAPQPELPPSGVVQPAPEFNPAPAPTQPPAHNPAPASDGKGLKIALVLSLLAVVALGSMSAYLWTVHSQYVAQNEELRATAHDLGTDLATSRNTAEDLQAQLAETREQLEVAKDTISGLANSEAQAGDDRLALIDVAEGLQECADARQDLIDHLNEAERWTAASLAASERSITTYCDRVTKSLNDLLDDN